MQTNDIEDDAKNAWARSNPSHETYGAIELLHLIAIALGKIAVASERTAVTLREIEEKLSS